MIVGKIDHASASGVWCDGLICAGTPGRRRYLMTKYVIRTMSTTNAIIEIQKIARYRKSTCPPNDDVAGLRNQKSWFQRCQKPLSESVRPGRFMCDKSFMP